MKLNDECRYSITRPYEGAQIIEIIKKFVPLEHTIITDGTACAGGDTINFSKYAKLVNSVEINKDNFNLLYENCINFGHRNITVYNEDYLKIYDKLNQDIIYLDPKWGGPDYKKVKKLRLYLGKTRLETILKKIISKKLARFIFIKAPLNVYINGVSIDDVFLIYNKKGLPSFLLLYIKI